MANGHQKIGERKKCITTKLIRSCSFQSQPKLPSTFLPHSHSPFSNLHFLYKSRETIAVSSIRIHCLSLNSALPLKNQDASFGHSLSTTLVTRSFYSLPNTRSLCLLWNPNSNNKLSLSLSLSLSLQPLRGLTIRILVLNIHLF